MKIKCSLRKSTDSVFNELELKYITKIYSKSMNDYLHGFVLDSSRNEGLIYESLTAQGLDEDKFNDILEAEDEMLCMIDLDLLFSLEEQLDLIIPQTNDDYLHICMLNHEVY